MMPTADTGERPTRRTTKPHAVVAVGVALLLAAALGSPTGAGTHSPAGSADPAPADAPPDETELEATSGASTAGSDVDFRIFTPTRLHANLRPTTVAVAPSGRHAYALGLNRLQKLDITANPARVLGGASNIYGTDIAIHPNNNTAYVINDNVLYIVDITRPSPRLVRQMSNVPNDSRALGIAPGGRFLFVVSGAYGINGVQIMSLETPRRPSRVSQVRTPASPVDVAVNGNGNRLVTANRSGKSVSIVDVSNKRQPRVIRNLRTSFWPEVVAVRGNRAYAWGEGAGINEPPNVAKINLGQNLIMRTRGLPAAKGRAPTGVDVAPDGAYVYLTIGYNCGDCPNIFVLDAGTMQTIARFWGAYSPVSVAVSTSAPTRGRAYIPSRADTFEGIPPVLYALRPRAS